MLTGQKHSFTQGDFEDQKARWNWSISAVNQSADTEIWSLGSGLNLGGNNANHARIGTQSAGGAFNTQIVWAVELPEEMRVTSFVWAVDTLRYAGSAGGDTQLLWQYSTDNSTWVDLMTPITLNAGLTNLSAQVYQANLASPSSSLYIRLFRQVNANAAGNQFFVYSNYGSDGQAGGSNSLTSYLEVTAVASVVPEPSTALLWLFGGGLLVAERLRRRGVQKG